LRLFYLWRRECFFLPLLFFGILLSWEERALCFFFVIWLRIEGLFV
jgi:hypothetical protein